MDELAAAIAATYEVFARYPPRTNMDGCPCCVSDRDQASLRGVPFAELPARRLAHFAHKAMNTWGEINDYKHFLPRVIEVEANESDAFAGIHVTLAKLEHARWREWPDDEVRAVSDALCALWRPELGRPLRAADPWQLLRDLDRVGLGDQCRVEWLAGDSHLASLHLAEAVRWGRDDAWLLSTAVRDYLERAFFRWGDDVLSEAHLTASIRGG